MNDMKKTKVLNLGQAASLADCSRDTLRRAAQREELAAELGPGKKGPQWWVREADLMDWLQGRRPGDFSPPECAGESPLGEEDSLPDLPTSPSEVAFYAEQARLAQQELALLRQELVKAQRLAEEATERLRVARTLIATIQQPARTARWKRVLQAITLGPTQN